MKRHGTNSARALLLEMHVEAVRYAYAQGVDVWAVWLARNVDPFRWENVKRAATVGAAFAPWMSAMAKRKES